MTGFRSSMLHRYVASDKHPRARTSPVGRIDPRHEARARPLGSFRLISVAHGHSSAFGLPSMVARVAHAGSGGDRGRSSAISRRISANSVLGTASGYRGAGEGASLSVRRYAIRSARSSAFASPSNCMPVPGAGAIRWATNALSASTPRRAVAKRRSARNRPATPPRGQILPTGLARPSASCPPGRPRDRTCNLSAASMSWSALAMPGPTRSVHAAIAATRDLFIWPTPLQLTPPPLSL